MPGYVYFTEEQKQRANAVDLEDFLVRQGEKLLRSGREKRLAGDHSITIRGNRWYDHATEKGGFAIDFVRTYYNQSFPEAVTMLLGGEQGQVYRESKPQEQEPAKRYLWDMMQKESPVMRISAERIPTVMRSKEMWTAVIRGTVFIGSGKAIRCMYLKRRLICFRFFPSTGRTGNSTAMWHFAV